MVVPFGFSIGDILECGRTCHEIYKACFSETRDAIASWNQLGREVYALGTALKALSTDNNIIPSYMYIKGEEGIRKEQRALEAVQAVVGDFKETLRQLKTVLSKFDGFLEAGGGENYLLKIRYSLNAGDLDRLRVKISTHARAVNLLLNPLIYQQMKGMQASQHKIQTSVWNIETRIDEMDQVLHALLHVALEQLPSTTATPRTSNNTRRPKDQPPLESSPICMQTVPDLLYKTNTGTAGRSVEAKKIMRSNSNPSETQGLQSTRSEGPPEINVPRRATDPYISIQPSFYKAALAGPGGRESGFVKHEYIDTKQIGKQTTLDKAPHSPLSQSSPKTPNSQPQETQRKTPADLARGDENPIDAALREQTETSEAQGIPIEHWVTAAMHWYFKAENELDNETEGHEVSPEIYLGLMKSTWIVENIIRQRDSEAELPQELRVNVETLIVSIVNKFKMMENRRMPRIRNLRKQDFEIWHADIKQILVKPTSLATRSILGESSEIFNEKHQSQEQPLSLGHSVRQNTHSRQVSEASSSSDRKPSPALLYDATLRYSLSPDSNMNQGLEDWSRRKESILQSAPLSSSHHDSVAPSEPSPAQDTFRDWPPIGQDTSESISQNSFATVSVLPESQGSPVSKYRDLEFMDHLQRSPSSSTTSTSSSNRRESLNVLRYPNLPNIEPGPVATPIRRKPLPQIIRKPVPSRDQTRPNTSCLDQQLRHWPINGHEFGERQVLDETPVLWASQSGGQFTRGSVRIFWHQSEEYFRLFTTWGESRSDSQDIPMKAIELIPAYGYEDQPIIFLRKANPRPAPSSGVTDTSLPAIGKNPRIGYIYKFHSSEGTLGPYDSRPRKQNEKKGHQFYQDILKFQAALTGEIVYQDLVKRVSAVKLRRSSEKGGHTYHNARLQLWHEKPPSDSLLPDTASELTGISQATRVKLSLQWPRLVIYLGASDCLITCFVTDDITLRRDGNKISLEPTRYSAKNALFKSPKGVKAVIAGGDYAQGGFRLDKDKVSWNDAHKFDDFAYIQIIFKETLYLNKFETLWNQMMDTRRRNRMRIRSLQKEIENRTYAPGYGT